MKENLQSLGAMLLSALVVAAFLKTFLFY